MVHWPLTGGLLHLVQRRGAWASYDPAVPNVTAHPSTASVPTSYYSMWHYNYLCALKGCIRHSGQRYLLLQCRYPRFAQMKSDMVTLFGLLPTSRNCEIDYYAAVHYRKPHYALHSICPSVPPVRACNSTRSSAVVERPRDASCH